MAKLRRNHFPARIATVMALLAMLLLSSLLAINPRLHALLHQGGEAGHESPPVSSADHQCAATLMAKGALDVPTPALLGLEFAPVSQASRDRTHEVILPTVEFRLLPERAPPVS